MTVFSERPLTDVVEPYRPLLGQQFFGSNV